MSYVKIVFFMAYHFLGTLSVVWNFAHYYHETWAMTQ